MILSLHITPKAQKSALAGWDTDAQGRTVLKVRVAAPPEDGKANAELLRFLAKEWGVTKAALELVSGESSRHKRLKINDDELAARIVTKL
jgi:uncharacterized protein (TIGR00251 family)